MQPDVITYAYLMLGPFVLCGHSKVQLRYLALKRQNSKYPA